MRNRLSYVLLAAATLAGCPTTAPTDANIIVIMDDGGTDSGTARPDTGPDTGVTESCNASGRVGAHCRSGTTATCVSGSMCANAIAGTVQTVFGIPSGSLMDPAHPDYQLLDTSATAQTAPFNAFSGGGLCLQQCDLDAAAGAAGSCGACTSCTTDVTQLPLVAAFGGIQAGFITEMYPNTGICRLSCTYDATTRGAECPADMTCDMFGNVCVESCTTDNECNTVYGVTYAGELVTIVNDTNPATCNTTTGRCDNPAGTNATAQVGDHCESNADCAPGNGICLSGGHCGEVGCPNPNTMTSTCGGTTPRGVCLSTSGAATPTTICITGCTTSADCGAGSICNTLWADAAMTMPFPIGSFTGYCVGQCDDDTQCISTEACTDYNTIDATSGAVTSNPGRCVPRCSHLNQVGTATGTTAPAGECLTSEWCAPDATNTNGHECTTDTDCNGMGSYNMCIFGVCRSDAPSFGQCQPLGAFCGTAGTRSLAAAAADCASGPTGMEQVCDETLATPHNATGGLRREVFGDGHCVDACTADADCSAYPTGSVCVTTGPLQGLCRVPCTSTATSDAGMECPTDQQCDATLGYCVEVMTPAA